MEWYSHWPFTVITVADYHIRYYIRMQFTKLETFPGSISCCGVKLFPHVTFKLNIWYESISINYILIACVLQPCAHICPVNQRTPRRWLHSASGRPDYPSSLLCLAFISHNPFATLRTVFERRAPLQTRFKWKTHILWSVQGKQRIVWRGEVSLLVWTIPGGATSRMRECFLFQYVKRFFRSQFSCLSQTQGENTRTCRDGQMASSLGSVASESLTTSTSSDVNIVLFLWNNKTKFNH